MWNTLNMVWNMWVNTAATAPRTLGTVLTAAADLFTALKTSWKESLEVIADTSQKVKNVMIKPWSEKTNIFKKSLKAAVSPVVAWVTIAEWVWRSVVQPVYNRFVNTKNTLVNTAKNGRRSTVGSLLSRKPISDFSFENLKTRKLNLKSWTAWWWLDKKDEAWEWKWENNETADEKDENDDDKKNEPDTKKPDSEWEKMVTIEKPKEEEKKEEKKTETIDTQDENVNVQKTKDILTNSQYWNKLYEKFQERFPWLKINYDKNWSSWKFEKKGDKVNITVWEKMPKDKFQIAPWNERKDIEHQKRHLIAHEFWHLIINDNSGDKDIDTISNISKKYLKDKKTITPIAQMDMYNSDDAKSKEDTIEMLAMWTLTANSLNKYLSRLTSDKKEDETYRKEFNLAKITEAEKDDIKSICKGIIWKYTSNENKWKTISLQSEKLKEENRDSNIAQQEHLAKAA